MSCFDLLKGGRIGVYDTLKEAMHRVSKKSLKEKTYHIKEYIYRPDAEQDVADELYDRRYKHKQ